MNISPTFISTMYYFIKLTIKLTGTALFLFVITFFIGLLFNNTSAIELLVYGPSVQVLSALIGIVLAIPLAGLIGFMSKNAVDFAIEANKRLVERRNGVRNIPVRLVLVDNN